MMSCAKQQLFKKKEDSHSWIVEQTWCLTSVMVKIHSEGFMLPAIIVPVEGGRTLASGWADKGTLRISFSRLFQLEVLCWETFFFPRHVVLGGV